MPKTFENLTGRTYGKLLVICFLRQKTYTHWLVKCFACGGVKQMQGRNIKLAVTCGCGVITQRKRYRNFMSQQKQLETLGLK